MEDINKKYEEFLDGAKLTEEQINDIASQMDEEIKGTGLEDIANLPSNNGQEESTDETRESGEFKKINVMLDPNSGENKILESAKDYDLEDNETFEEMIERLEKEDIKVEIDNSPISENEFSDYLKSEDMEGSMAESIIPELSNESIKELLSIVNRKNAKEEFNIYKAFPQEVRGIVDKYIINEFHIPINSQSGKEIRNMISEQLIDEFITNISIKRSIDGFNKEIEEIFSKGNNEIADSIVGYTEERNKRYREYAESIEDEEKKEKILVILDNIDEAFKLDKLKEFSKKCKIKNYDIENPSRIYKDFLLKYSNSTYSIYDINLAVPILYRNINTDVENPEFSERDIHAFFIVFCKQCLNMSSENVNDHAYMYYVVYNVVLMDINKGENKNISDDFLKNIREVIANIKTRNTNI